MSLRERNRLQTRVAIEAAALELFRDRGFDRTTVGDIADRAGISPRTFFRYFPSKDHVIFTDHAAALAELRGRLRSALAELLSALRATATPDDDALAEVHLLNGAVFGALRGARRAAGRTPDPDPQALIARAFALVAEGISGTARRD